MSEQEGELLPAQKYYEQALEGYRALGDQHGETVALVNLTRLFLRQRILEQAEQCASQARVIADKNGFTDEINRLKSILADNA